MTKFTEIAKLLMKFLNETILHYLILPKQPLKLLMLTLVLGFSKNLFAQNIISGQYNSGLNLAYDTSTKIVSGYFEDASGWNEITKSPQFSCVFYIIGKVTGNKFTINTFYPNEINDTIKGYIQLINDSNLVVSLNDEHGGCWNVKDFKNEQANFRVEKQEPIVQIRFVKSNKAYFYDEVMLNKKRKSYLVKNNFVYVNKIINKWAYCTFYGDVVTKGWIRLTDLNNNL